jgi:hypothetical protein
MAITLPLSHSEHVLIVEWRDFLASLRPSDRGEFTAHVKEQRKLAYVDGKRTRLTPEADLAT